MNDLLAKLKEMTTRVSETDAPLIEAAIERIKLLEAKLASHEDDITDWQAAVQTQMGRKRDNK